LELGMSLEVVTPSRDPLKEIQSSFFNFSAMVPLQIHQLVKEKRIDELNKIEKLIIGGASLNEESLSALQQVDTKVYATYGMTETASHIALKKLNGPERQGSFYSLPGVKITANKENCAVIETPFHHGLVTNDIIELHSDGSFDLMGRADNIINSGGVKISMEKVEQAIEKA
jgi:O-succinylbenzoic acid--CoA ligase